MAGGINGAERHKNFLPFINAESRILILGSFPSVKSRETGFYYGNPQNRFWKTLAAACGTETPATVEQKKAFLLANKIALWDVIAETSLTGSSDANIKEENSAAENIKSIFGVSKELKVIICNGKKAFGVFLKEVPCPPVTALYLSSTSSANPAFRAEDWIKTLREYL